MLRKFILPISIPTLFVLLIFNTSCVGKKKFLREMANRDSIAQFLNVRNLELNRELGHLKMDLAEKTGERNAFREIYDKQVLEIKKLEKEIERLNSQSSSTQQSLNEEVRKRDSQLADKEQQIKNFGLALQRHEAAIDMVLEEFRTALSNYPPADFNFEHKEYRGIVVISEKQLFRPSTDQPVRSANALIEKIARVINNHPDLQFQVVGHSDSHSAVKGFQSRLEFSARRAASLAEALTKDYYVNGSQITASGRSDFEPRASNETEEGRSQNRRLELIFYPRVDEVRKMASEVDMN